MYDLRIIFLVFIIYAVIGWFIEVINFLLLERKFINRGFLIGPYCPIYGVGSVFITLLISPTNDIISTFLKAMVICSILEYLTSYLMEKLFKTRWWDYSKNKFNINGRICLETMVLFGLGGVILVKYMSPFILELLTNLNPLILNIIVIILAIIFITDVIVSYNIINNFKKVPKMVKKDSTEEITRLVKQTLKNKNYFSKRLVNSFPNFKTIVKKYDKKLEKRKLKLERKIEKDKKKLNDLENK